MKTNAASLFAAALLAMMPPSVSFAGPAEELVKAASDAVGASKKADKEAKDASDAAAKHDRSAADAAADTAAADAAKAAGQADDSADKAAKAKRDADDAADAAKKAGKSDKDAAKKAAEEKKKADAAEVDRKLDEENAKKKEKAAGEADDAAKKKDDKIEDRKVKAEKEDARKKRKAARDARRKAKKALRDLEDLIEKRKRTEGGKPSSKTEELQDILDGLRKAFGGGDQPPPAGDKKGILQQAAAGRIAFTVSGTGETIGKVAQMLIVNLTGHATETEIPPTMLTGGGSYQPYIVPTAVKISLAPFQTKVVPIEGICQDARKPPSTAESGPLKILDPSAADFPKTVANQVAGAQRLQDTVAKLQKKGAIRTPFSGNPAKERETVIQQTFWIYTALLNGKPYTKEEFANKLYTQGGFQPPHEIAPLAPPTEAKPGKKGANGTVKPEPLKKPTEAQSQTLDKGVDQFWDTFQLTGKEAKILD